MAPHNAASKSITTLVTSGGHGNNWTIISIKFHKMNLPMLAKWSVLSQGVSEKKKYFKEHNSINYDFINQRNIVHFLSVEFL